MVSRWAQGCAISLCLFSTQVFAAGTVWVTAPDRNSILQPTPIADSFSFKTQRIRPSAKIKIDIDPTKTYQHIIGYGASAHRSFGCREYSQTSKAGQQMEVLKAAL